MMTFAALCTLDRSFDQVAQDAAEDEAYMALLRYHSQGQKTLPPEAQEFRSLDLDSLRKRNKLLFIGDRLLVPKKSRRRLLRLLHASHQGFKKMQALAARHYVWPRMNNDIRNVVSGCAPCQSLAPARQRGPPNEKNQFDIKNMYPMSNVSMDLFQIGTSHYLVQVDRYSLPCIYSSQSLHARIKEKVSLKLCHHSERSIFPNLYCLRLPTNR